MFSTQYVGIWSRLFKRFDALLNDDGQWPYVDELNRLWFWTDMSGVGK